MIIYKIRNKINKKIYIGLTTKDLSKRIAEHVSENKSYIQKALNKYGLQSFAVTIIDSAESRAVLCEKERYWIQHYNCKAPNGYNLTDGGDGLINPSKVVRNKISNTLKEKHIITKGFAGRNHSAESRKAISEGLLNSKKRKKYNESRLGKKIKPFTEEHKRNIGLANKGNKRPDLSEMNKARTTRTDYVNPMKGKKRPDLSERNKLCKGKPRIFSNPEERARKISESRKGKKYSKQKLYLVASN